MSQNYDEPVIYQGKLHRGIFLLPILLMVVLTLPGLYMYITVRNSMLEASTVEHNAMLQMSQIMDKTGLVPPEQTAKTIEQFSALEQPNEELIFSVYLLPHLEFAFLIGVIFYVIVTAAYLRSEVVLSTNRLKFSTGLFSYSKAEVNLAKVESLTLVHPLFGRMLGYGKIVVNGTGGTVFRLTYLPQTESLYGLLQQMTRGAPRAPTPSVQELTRQLDDMHSRYMPKE